MDVVLTHSASCARYVHGKLTPALLDTLPVTPDVCMAILTDYLRPLFQRGHARVHSETGRAIHARTSAGAGAAAWDDTMPAWQSTALDGHGRLPLGCVYVLGWILTHLQEAPMSVWDRAWPLVLPPTMVLLDAPSVPTKIQGACVARLVWRCAPSALLHRTGVASLLRETLTSMLSFMSEPTYGPPLFSAVLDAQLASLSSQPSDAQYEQVVGLLSHGVFTALSYCAPASASVHVLAPSAPDHTSTLHHARLQQVLAGTALTWASVLYTRLGEASLRFWHAHMDWAVAWLEHAFQACTPPFPFRGLPRRPVSEMVDDLVEQGTLRERDATPDEAWDDAAAALLASVCACLEATCTLVDIAVHAPASTSSPPWPAYAPGLATWGPRLVSASCMCLVRWRDLHVTQPPSIVAQGETLCAHLQSLVRTLSASPVPAIAESIQALAKVVPAQVAYLTAAPSAT